MARARDGGGWWWWWLAPPLIGVAAYLGFEATLSFIAPDEDARVARPRVRQAPAAASRHAEPVAAPAVDLMPASPEPSATMAPERAAAADARPRAAAKRNLPRESLTEADRRALDAVVERATRGRRSE